MLESKKLWNAVLLEGGFGSQVVQMLCQSTLSMPGSARPTPFGSSCAAQKVMLQLVTLDAKTVGTFPTLNPLPAKSALSTLISEFIWLTERLGYCPTFSPAWIMCTITGML